MSNWGNQLMFESYLHDYLFQVSMHENVELFKNELNSLMDHKFPPRSVVPEGFLQEWWSGCYDNFDNFRGMVIPDMGCTAWEEAPSDMEFTMENQSLGATQGSFAYQTEQNLMTKEAENQLADDVTPALSRESDSKELDAIGEVPLLYFPASYLELYGDFAQLLLPFSCQVEQLKSTLGVVNTTKTSGKSVESSMQYTPKPENTTINEEPDPVIENLLNSFWLFWTMSDGTIWQIN
ncbi:hypothetical protein RIF29_03595 [Crotalaria pallida]|uniref:Uncharacterized protein n=1 Tax=Crotalaria pallida TaxID=3830 RepID=A0AAN9P9J3_CROPI